MQRNPGSWRDDQQARNNFFHSHKKLHHAIIGRNPGDTGTAETLAVVGRSSGNSTVDSAAVQVVVGSVEAGEEALGWTHSAMGN